MRNFDKKPAAIPEVDLSGYTLDSAVVKLIPASLAEKHKIIPLFKVGNTLTLAMADPKNIMALDEVRGITKMDILVVKASVNGIEEAISGYYGITGIVESVLKDYHPLAGGLKAKALDTIEAPIIEFVNAVLAQAVRERASDIHVEPEAKDVRVRFRVDGLLHEEFNVPSTMLPAIVSRIKILSSMNIAESRVPQDGRFEIKKAGKTVDLRVSTFPSAYGEKVVMRILDKSSLLLSLAEIGFAVENLERFRKIIHKPHGIVLVTGPTGSGKTTTLYSALAEINSKELNIITVEDPIEYELAGITQSQVNVKAGLTFATALRSILRQDPDVIMVGEIRDLETASIAVQSALTGHLVFSTLHTNDAAGALTRLVDMGIEPFLISSSVEAVLAQRLVRTICKKCEEAVPAPEILKQKFPDIKTVRKGKGCKACKMTGYRGRVGIYELLMLDDTIRKMITDKVPASEIKQYAVKHGMRTLYDDGLEKIKAGKTTLDEVLRVTELE
jgi:type IV pilus assembly protein PilB